ALRRRYPQTLRRSGWRADRRTRRGNRKARPDACHVQRNRSRPADAPQMRFRRKAPAQSRQGFSEPETLRRIGANACASRRNALSRSAALLMTDFHPATIEDLADIVASAAAGREPLEILGNGTKRGIGRPIVTPHRVSTAKLSAVTLYEPEELILSAKAGTPLSEIEALLAQHNQQLAFEPPHWGEQTIGGVIATGFSGPRRIQAGAVRDHLLGFTAVNGRGEIFKAGGRVVKNVTGYDLSKLMTGSFGTLAVLSEVTLKVLPRPEARATLVLKGKTARQAITLFREALAMPLDITGAAWVP